MTIFNYVTAIVMLIIGLGLTHLLGDVVYAFQDRRRTKPDWVPFVWAALIFAAQMQFLWAIYELQDLIPQWTVFEFAGLLFMALLLFTAGALVVPRDNQEGSDGWALFLENGRWSLAVMAFYNLLAYMFNPLFFGSSWVALSNLMNLLLCLLLVFIQFGSSRKAWLWGTAVYLLAAMIGIIIASPGLYD